MLPTVVKAFVRAHPSVSLQLHEARSDQVVEGVRRGVHDVGVIATMDKSLLQGVVTHPWRNDELVVVAPPGVSEKDVNALPLLTFPRGSPTRALLDEALATKTIFGGSIAMELGHIAAIKAHVRAGVGRALISRTAVQADIAARRLAVVAGVSIPRQLYMVVAEGPILAPAVEAFLDVMNASTCE